MKIEGNIKWFKDKTEELLTEIENLKTEDEVSKWLKEFNYATDNLFNAVIQGKKSLTEEKTKKEKYEVTIETLKDEMKTQVVELLDAINVCDYIVLEGKLIWITKVDGYHLFGIEQAETLEQCDFLIKENKVRK